MNVSQPFRRLNRRQSAIPERISRLKFSHGLSFLCLMLMACFGVLLLSHQPAHASGVIPAAFSPQKVLQDALDWVRGLGVWSIGAFILIYIIATVAFLPGSVLTLGAGAIFGVVFGAIYVFVGATIGAIAAFLVGRYVARGWISKKIEGNTKFASIDRAVGKEGFKIVLLTRLSPVFPFNLLNYAMGLTSVSLRDYALASVGMLPGTIMYVYIGSLAGDIGAGASTAQNVLKVVGLIATVIVTVFVTRIARKALEQEIA